MNQQVFYMVGTMYSTALVSNNLDHCIFRHLSGVNLISSEVLRVVWLG